jgi:capsular polysaccharide biosynthesis protein
MQDAKYRKYSDNQEQARIDQALEQNKISNISVVQPAIASTEPVKPRKSLNLALGFFLGIFGALGLAFFCEYLDHSIKNPSDVEEKLKLPVLTSISFSKGEKNGNGKYAQRSERLTNSGWRSPNAE